MSNLTDDAGKFGCTNVCTSKSDREAGYRLRISGGEVVRVWWRRGIEDLVIWRIRFRIRAGDICGCLDVRRVVRRVG